MKRQIEGEKVLDSIYESILPEFRHMVFDLEDKDVDEEITNNSIKKIPESAVNTDINSLKENLSTKPVHNIERLEFEDVQICDAIANAINSKKIEFNPFLLSTLHRLSTNSRNMINFQISPIVMVKEDSLNFCHTDKAEYNIVIRVRTYYNTAFMNIGGELIIPKDTICDYNNATIHLTDLVNSDNIKRAIRYNHYDVYDIFKHFKIINTDLAMRGMLG